LQRDRAAPGRARSGARVKRFDCPDAGIDARGSERWMESMIPQRVRTTDFGKMKRRGEKITMLTAYDATMARLLDRAELDALLVGDSLGMGVLGHDSTLPVTLEAMIHHTRAVSRGAERALIVADMPFLSYQVTVTEAVRNAGRLLQEGRAHAVKVEGGRAT